MKAQKPLTVPAPPSESPAAMPAGPISFDVVVTDKAGHPVHGLQQSDFILEDDKHPTPIQSFAAHEIASSENQEAVFLILDDVNAGFDAISLERTQIENYLRSDGGRLAAPMGIFLLTDDGLKQIANVSSDGNELANVLHAKDGQLHQIPRSTGFWGATERLDICIRSMEQFVSWLGKAPGRKLAIWISPGWPIFDNPNVTISAQEQRRIFGTVVDFSSAMRAANVTLYSIDPLGPLDAASTRSFLWENFRKPVTKPTKADPGDLALQVMVEHTGGKVLLGSNDITGEIRNCVQDGLAWYSVTFEPQPSETPDTWHDIQVKVNRQGVVVRTRNGYYGEPPAANHGQ
ncbi:MAG TPA: VWA domain-containing protein [Acidobacteriaceae bacterium]|nr:VWA domain-containing protein [Acidobacteriaceae bacterium]